jgi:SepF-like predicted cell division protein (DUF552 family)
MSGLQTYKKFQAYKDSPCTDCGKRFPPECMDWDHVTGVKIMPVSRIRNLRDFLIEIEKCDLVCANCHRIRTSNRYNTPVVQRINTTLS